MNQLTHRGDKIEFQVTLKRYEYFAFHVTPKDAALELTIVDPKNEPIQFYSVFDRDTEVNLANDLPGIYKVSITGSSKIKGRGDGSFTIDRIQHFNTAERLHPPTESVVGKRIKDLKHEIKNEKSAAVRRFWEELKQSGAPLNAVRLRKLTL